MRTPRLLPWLLSLIAAGAITPAPASTFEPSAEELQAFGLERASHQGRFEGLAPQVDETGASYYQVDDVRYRVDASQPDSGATGNRWPAGVVYYQFDAAVTAAHRQLWRDASEMWRAGAPLTFIESTGNGSYIIVRNSDVNNSYVGMTGGSQTMNISDWYTDVIAHEIGHALGLEHEQSRSDRDSYVIIRYENIKPDAASNFDRLNTINYGAYDFTSIMHYYRLAFSQNGLNTIEPQPAYSQYLNVIGTATSLSAADLAGMAQRYQPLTNDSFATRISLSGNSGSISGTNQGATRENLEPNHYRAGGASVWYTWTAPASGSTTIDTIGSNFDTLLAVYTGSSVSALTTIAGDDDSAGNAQSRVTFIAVAGVAYQIAVDGYGGRTGNFSLNWRLTPEPANNHFANRTPLYGATGTIAGTNVSANRQTGEPTHAGYIGGASVWYSWTAPATGTATIDTLTSNFDTLLAVYTGTSVESLSHIASNANAPGSLQSSITFSAIGGVTYQIAVDGYAGATGNIGLRWSGAIVRYGKADFNGDGQSDIIWQNKNNGQRAIWAMNGASWVGERFLNPVAVAWEIAGTGDFNGDGQADIVWQNNVTGQRAIWLMNGSTYAGERFLPTIPTEWKIVGTGDFNADTNTDLVWENVISGARAIWLMNGVTWTGERLLPSVPTVWHIAGTGDFNGDGQIDLLWQNNANGVRAIWLMNGSTWIGERFLPTVPIEWQIAGTGEFNGDAKVDIVWENKVTGQRAIWLMNGSAWVGERFLPNVPTEWEIRNH